VDSENVKEGALGYWIKPGANRRWAQKVSGLSTRDYYWWWMSSLPFRTVAHLPFKVRKLRPRL